MEEKVKEKITLLNRVVIAFICILVILSFSKPKENVNSQYLSGIENTINVADIYRHNKETDEKIKLPHVVSTMEPFVVSVDLSEIQDLSGKSVAIHSGYADIKLYIDKKVFEEINVGNSDIIYAGGGYSYYIVDLPKEIIDKTLYIEYIPRLRLNTASKYDIYPIHISDRIDIITDSLKNDWPGLLLSAILIFSFFVIVIIVSVIRKIDNENKIGVDRLHNVGLVCLLMALYNFCAQFRSVKYLLSEYSTLLYFMEYLSFLYFAIPVLRIVRISVSTKFHKSLDINIIILFINFIIQTFLTLRGILGFKDMLIVTQVLQIISFTHIIVAMIFTDSKKYPEKKDLMISMFPILLNMVLGYVTYMFTAQIIYSMLLLLNILLFIGAQVYFLSKKYMIIQEENLKNKFYKKIIGIDVLTEMGNRYSFEKHIEDIKANPRDVTVIVADMNNLKNINDSLGHDHGDMAIVGASAFLKKNLPDADIYRVGGDEFFILSEKDIHYDDIEKLKNKTIHIKGSNDDIQISFAVGYHKYNASSGENIDDIVKLADQNMYIEKKKSKIKKKI